jgi:hypothetical protein
MFAWTKQMNFTRWVIVIALAASGVLGFLYYTEQERLTELEDQTSRVARLAEGIVRGSYELQSLRKIASARQDLDNVNSHITRTAAKPNVEIGSVDITSSTSSVGPGVEDVIYTVKPPSIERRPEYVRTRIANFAFSLEQNMPVRVTKLRIFPPSHLRTPDHEVAPDLWTFEIDVRQRKRVEQAPR